jgi:hypothetical protein
MTFSDFDSGHASCASAQLTIPKRRFRGLERGDASNTRCERWLELTRADAKVYQACHAASLRFVDGQQPYLNIGNHSSLLTNKASQPPP